MSLARWIRSLVQNWHNVRDGEKKHHVIGSLHESIFSGYHCTLTPLEAKLLAANLGKRRIQPLIIRSKSRQIETFRASIRHKFGTSHSGGGDLRRTSAKPVAHSGARPQVRASRSPAPVVDAIVLCFGVHWFSPPSGRTRLQIGSRRDGRAIT
jgi:hypothetical protein